MPDSISVVDVLLVDDLGGNWVGHRFADDADLRTWAVFANDGVFLAELDMPADLFIREIGQDYVLATTRDDLGVPYVLLFSLQRGDSDNVAERE